MHERIEWEASLEEAWGEFRRSLADALAGLAERSEGVLGIEWGADLLGDFDHDAEYGNDAGAAPYVQAQGWGEGMVRVEAVSNYFLADRFALSDEAIQSMDDAGFLVPTVADDEEQDDSDGGSPNFWLDLEGREADRAAWAMVHALREAYGSLHPAMLVTHGIPMGEPDAVGSGSASRQASDDEDQPLCWPASRSELMDSVLITLRTLHGAPLRQDSDGDVPFRRGRSVAYVRVLSDRPAVEIFAHLLYGADRLDPHRLAVEMNILNRNHEATQFYVADELVMMRSTLEALPFSPVHLQVALECFCSQMDDIARDLVERVGGRRFLDAVDEVDEVDGPDDADDADDADDPDAKGRQEASPTLDALIEMLRDGRLSSRAVIELFDGDAAALARALSRVRSGAVSCDPVPVEHVLAVLRRALRSLVRRDAQRAREQEGGTPRRLQVLDADDPATRQRGA